MAKAAAKAQASEPAEGSGQAEGSGRAGGSGKLVLIVVVLLAVLGGGGAAAWFLLAGEDKAESVAAEKPKPRVPPVFVKLEPFVVNLADRGRYLQVGLELRVPDARAAEQIKVFLPEIRNVVLMVLSGRPAEEILSAEGKERSRADIRRVASKALGIEVPAQAWQAVMAKLPEAGVLDVLLASFVIQ